MQPTVLEIAARFRLAEAVEAEWLHDALPDILVPPGHAEWFATGDDDSHLDIQVGEELVTDIAGQVRKFLEGVQQQQRPKLIEALHDRLMRVSRRLERRQ